MSLNLKTKKDEIPREFEPISLRIGGINVYSKDSENLNKDLALFSDEINKVFDRHILLSNQNLRYYFKNERALDIPKRLFSVLTGRELRIGNLDRIACESINGKIFFVNFHRKRKKDLISFMEKSLEILLNEQKVDVTQVRNEFFPNQEWNSWITTGYFFSRLIFFGFAYQEDKFTFIINPLIKDAKLQNLKHLYTSIG